MHLKDEKTPESEARKGDAEAARKGPRGKRAVGISRASVLKFLQRRVAGPVVK